MSTRAVIKNQIRSFIGKRAKAIVEYAIANIKLVRADGNTKDTDITLVDADGNSIGANATILGCIEVTANTGALVDHTEEASVTAAGKMQLDTTDTSGDDLLVLLIDWDDNQ